MLASLWQVDGQSAVGESGGSQNIVGLPLYPPLFGRCRYDDVGILVSRQSRLRA